MALLGKLAFSLIILVSDASSVISVEDFVLDKKSLIGQTVNVEGLAFCMNDLCYINAPGESVSSALFDADQLDRPSRKRLLNCDLVEHPCKVVLTGLVADDLITSLNATSIKFESDVSPLKGMF